MARQLAHEGVAELADFIVGLALRVEISATLFKFLNYDRLD